MFSMRVTPACWRAALVVAIVGITYNQENIELYAALKLECHKIIYEHNSFGSFVKINFDSFPVHTRF